MTLLILALQCLLTVVPNHAADTLTWAARQFKQDALVVINLPGIGVNERTCTQMYQGGQVMAEHCWVPTSSLEADEWPDWDLTNYTIIVTTDQRMPDGTLWTRMARPIAPTGYDPTTEEQPVVCLDPSEVHE